MDPSLPTIYIKLSNDMDALSQSIGSWIRRVLLEFITYIGQATRLYLTQHLTSFSIVIEVKRTYFVPGEKLFDLVTIVLLLIYVVNSTFWHLNGSMPNQTWRTRLISLLMCQVSYKDTLQIQEGYFSIYEIDDE